jgi:hypothetical protein
MEVQVSQLSLRGFDKELERHLRGLARREGLSLNKAALLLMRRGAGLEHGTESRDVVGTTLDGLIGCWSAAQEKAFLDSIAVLDTVDESLWR